MKTKRNVTLDSRTAARHYLIELGIPPVTPGTNEVSAGFLNLVDCIECAADFFRHTVRASYFPVNRHPSPYDPLYNPYWGVVIITRVDGSKFRVRLWTESYQRIKE